MDATQPATDHPEFVTVTVPASDLRETVAFLEFLGRAARPHGVVDFSLSNTNDKEICLTMPFFQFFRFGRFLQDIAWTKGLYYYLCTTGNRRQVARSVVKPVFEELLLACFGVVYPVQITGHLLQGRADWLAGEFTDRNAQQYEMLFKQLELRMLTGWEFIRNLDDLLTEFMLIKLGHKKGDKSPNFGVLVGRCGQQQILRNDKVKTLFNRVHELRTKGLHRLERELPEADLWEIAHTIHNVFYWLNDYERAQAERTVVLQGKRYRRVRYGQEVRTEMRLRGHNSAFKRHMSRESIKEWDENVKRYSCHDCDVILNELHLAGCDVEICPRCGCQYLCCECSDN